MSKAARQRYDDVLCVAVCEITNIQADLDTVMFESQVLSHVPSATDAAAVAASGTCPNKPVSAAVPPANQSHQSSAAQTEGASPSNSSFWTASTEVNVASYLNSRFNGEFEEHTNYEGTLKRTSSDAIRALPGSKLITSSVRSTLSKYTGFYGVVKVIQKKSKNNWLKLCTNLPLLRLFAKSDIGSLMYLALLSIKATIVCIFTFVCFEQDWIPKF